MTNKQTEVDIDVNERNDNIQSSPPSTSSAGSDDWRECVQWMIRLGVIDASHRVNWPGARSADFAQMLR